MARQPSSNVPVVRVATTTKLKAVPAPVAARIPIPITTVQSHTVTPVGEISVGRRQARQSSQAAANPARNGQAVSATPDSVTDSAWLRRPTAQNSTTAAASTAKAKAAIRGLVAIG